MKLHTFDIWRNRGFSDKLEQGAERHVAEFLAAVEQNPVQAPIDPDSVDYEFRNPQAVAGSFAATLGYLARVELDVARNVEEIEHVFGKNMPEVDRQFVNFWGLQELHHGYILDRATSLLGLPAPAVDLHIGASIKAAGILSNVPGLRDAMFFGYMATGEVTEASASRLYRKWSWDLTGMGEGAFANTAIDRINRQEPKHLAYYKMRGRQVRDTLSHWQILLARTLKERTMPITGVRNKWHKRQLGQMVIELTGVDNSENSQYTDLVRQVQSVYDNMMYFEGQGAKVPGAVMRSLAECVEIARE